MNEDLIQTLRSLVSAHVPLKKFIPGQTYIPINGKVFDEDELLLGIEAILDGWWTEGRFALQFEKQFKEVSGCNYVTLVNSGSSANLIALTSLTSSVFGNKALKEGDEVITLAAGFPTTVNPILQNRLIPVFIDVDLKTKNVLVSELKKAVTSKTKAIMMAHTLGNPMPMREIMEVVQAYNLWLIEDCCDALGASYHGKKVGTFGHVATYSFYPAHQITMGEGGAVVTNNPLIYKANRQFRDWGRDCWCDTGKDNTCGKRFDWQLGKLPAGYDHKFIYSQIGYNVKLTDMQAAIGCAQLKKLPKFLKMRNRNFELLKKHLSQYQKYFEFSEPEIGALPSWFGFMISVKKSAPFTKLELVRFLELKKIGTRSLFAGNLLKHPGYVGRTDIRIASPLLNTDFLMENGFWIGVYPGITEEMIEYMSNQFTEFIGNKAKKYH